MTTHLGAEDQALLDCLRRVTAVYDADEKITQKQRQALAKLIDTYTCEPDGDFGDTPRNMLRGAVSIEDVRQRLALDAGIVDLAQLKFFTSIDESLSQGKLRTTSLKGYSEEQILALSQP